MSKEVRVPFSFIGKKKKEQILEASRVRSRTDGALSPLLGLGTSLIT